MGGRRSEGKKGESKGGRRREKKRGKDCFVPGSAQEFADWD